MTRRTRGFSLVELMIVVLVIGLLMSIAVPQWVKARDRSRENTCMLNLRRIEDAKEHLAMQNRLSNGAPVSEPDLVSDYLKGSVLPRCPEGGTYVIHPIGQPPACTVHTP